MHGGCCQGLSRLSFGLANQETSPRKVQPGLFFGLCYGQHMDLEVHGHVCISLVSFSGGVSLLAFHERGNAMVHLFSPAPVDAPHSLCLSTATFWPRPSAPTACSLQKALPGALLEVLSDVGACFQAWQAIPHSRGNAGMPPEPPLVGRVMLMGTCSGSTWRRAGAGSGAGPFLEAVRITAETSFDSCTTNKHANKPTNPSDITRAEKYNYRAQVSSINLTLVLWRALKPATA